jgi:hypothetical protein
MKQIKINYAPNTIQIIGEIGKQFILIQNSKETNFTLRNSTEGIKEHCKKCKEQILSILN